MLTSVSMFNVALRMVAYSLSPKPVALNDGGHFTTVYECSDRPSMSQAQVLFFQASMTAFV